MKTYYLYLKGEYMDYEDEVEANSFDEAIDYFMGYAGRNGWERDVIEKSVKCDDECPECHTDLVKQVETRDGTNFEEVWYCNGCGYTETRKEII